MATVLITGANRGIGLALTRAFLADGHTVTGTARDPGMAEELKATGANVIRLDVNDKGSVEALDEAVGDAAIDILINNAGVGGSGEFGSFDYDVFADLISTNVFGPLRVTEKLADNLEKGNEKIVANISSIMGSLDFATSSFATPYRTSKAALNMAMKCVAHDLSAKGITMLLLHPGHVETEMGGKGAPVKPDESAAGLMKVILGAKAGDKLKLQDYQGKTINW